MEALGTRLGPVEKRNLLSSFFITMLIALAYQEMIPPVRTSVRSSGITFGTACLVIVFLLTSIRFFVGNQLHLLSDALTRMGGGVWLFDLSFIIVESVLLVFAGGVTSQVESRNTTYSFPILIVALWGVDVIWIFSQVLLGRILPSCRRDFIPRDWAILNTILVICVVLLAISVGDLHSQVGLTLFLGLNIGGFVIDMILLDHYGLLKKCDSAAGQTSSLGAPTEPGQKEE